MAAYSRRDFLKGTLATSAGLAAGLSLPNIVTAQAPIKIGVLHSLSGTMAISEVSLRDVVLMAVEEINAKGGVMGRKIQPVVVDPASNWDLFAEKAKQLLLQDKVAVVFGCWTSVSRKSVLPVFEGNNGLLFYPVQYEGEECSKNVFYTGATPNQQLIPAAEYMMSKEGGSYKKFYLLGTDYVFPRTANKILRAFLLAKGVPAANIEEEYTPFNHQDYQTIRRPPRGLELLPVRRHPAEQEVRQRVQGVRRQGQAPRRRQARDRRPDGGRVLRCLRVEAGRREGQEHRRRCRPQGGVRPGVPGAGRQDQDGRGQPPHLQAGAHR